MTYKGCFCFINLERPIILDDSTYATFSSMLGITVLVIIGFGMLFKMKIRRRLKRICTSFGDCRWRKHSALGGTHCRNIATLNDELCILAFCVLCIVVEVFLYRQMKANTSLGKYSIATPHNIIEVIVLFV